MENDFGNLLMNSIDFKRIFGECAVENGFERAYEGWFKEFPDVIQVLELQKSNYANRYYLNMKVFIQGVFGNNYKKSKQLVKTIDGEISLRQPDDFSPLLDLDNNLNDFDRMKGLKILFKEFINPFFSKTTSKQKIIESYKTGEVPILSAVRKQLGIK